MPLSVGDRERAERALKRNILKRDQVMEQFSVLIALVGSVTNKNEAIPMLKARGEDIELLITDFRIYQDAILDQLIDLERDTEFSTTHAPVGKLALEQYYSIKVKSKELGLTNQNPLPPVTTSSVQLPKIQLPSFDGKILHWRSFRDTFISLVHENAQLSDIQKFHYLLSVVSGSAASVVRSVPLSEANYSIVWKTLNDRFDNKRVLLSAHLDILFRFSPLKVESLIDLRHFLTTFRENIAALKVLEVDDLAGFLLFYIASRVLDPATRQSFEFEYHDAEIPTFDMLAEFVQVRCQVLQNSTSHLKLDDNYKKNSRSKFSLVTSSVSESLICILCKENHLLYKCPKFIQQNVKQRFRLARSNRLCMNCLCVSHKTNDCKSTYSCRHCSSKHHSLLHFDTRTSKDASSTNGCTNTTQTPSVSPTPISSFETEATILHL